MSPWTDPLLFWSFYTANFHRAMTKTQEIRDIALTLLRTHTINQTSQIVGVSCRTIIRWKHSPWHRCASQETRGRRSQLDSGMLTSIKAWLALEPQLTLVGIQERIHTTRGIRVGLSTVGRWLRLVGMTRKRVSYRNSEALLPRVETNRRDFLARIKRGKDTGWMTFVNVDECSWNRH